MEKRARRSLRPIVGVLILTLGIIVAGTWAAVKLTTDYLLYQNATSTARSWARYLADNVTDLEQIASGEQPSVASMAFFEGTRKGSQVFRYVIFNRDGYSQLISDRNRIALVDVSDHDSAAVQTLATSEPVVAIKETTASDLPAFFAEAYVPVFVNQQAVGAVAAYVDQTEQRDLFYRAFLAAGASLCLLTGLSFAIPGAAWYRRTKEKQQADRRIRFLAHHDSLTGLANRMRLIEKLNLALAAACANRTSIAVHFIDLDRFKEVNDTLGHDGGDFLLKSVAQRLRSATRAGDIVARLGGDEFIVVQADVSSKQVAERFAQRLLSGLAAPLQFNDQEIVCLASIGVAVAPDDGEDAERLLKSADLALYKCKADGRNCVRFFSPEMDAALLARLKLERMLRDAILHGRFELHYQPVFAIPERTLIGFEALLRLPGEDGTLIPPATFIPLAEELHLIEKIGAWVLREACRTATTWPSSLTVAVNLSPTQFSNGQICRIVAEALNDTGLEPHRLELEITESLLLGDNAAVLAELQALKAMGVAIVMDDFGTGYSSLSYLWRFPFDKIKIDRSFMKGFDDGDRDAKTVVKTIIALGWELRMRVTVEGVETSRQVAFLDHMEADQVQGFFFGRPMPAADVAAEILSDFQRQTSSTVRPASEERQSPTLSTPLPQAQAS